MSDGNKEQAMEWKWNVIALYLRLARSSTWPGAIKALATLAAHEYLMRDTWRSVCLWIDGW